MVANAGIAPMQAGDDGWQDVIDVNLTGVHHTVEVAIRPMIEQGDGGAIVLTSSVAGPGRHRQRRCRLDRLRRSQARASSDLMRVYANLLAQHSIRVNSMHPAGVRHPDDQQRVHPRMAGEHGHRERLRRTWATRCRSSVLQPEDIANAVAWLVSDAARYVTGVTLPVDAGYVNKR